MKKYLKETKTIQLVIILTMILSSLLMVINSYFNTWMTNAIIDGNISKFIKLAIGVVISMSLVPLLSYINGKFISRSDQRIANNLREDYIDNFIMTYTPKTDRKKLSADVISQMTNDVNFIIDKGVNVFYSFLEGCFGVVFPLLGAALIHPIFLLVFPLSVVFQTILIGKISPKIQALAGKYSKQNQVFVSSLSDLFEGFDTYFRMGNSGIFKDKFISSSEGIEEKKYIHSEKQFFYKSIMMGLMIISQFLYILVAGILVAKRVTSPGSIVGLISLAQSFYSNTQVAMNQYMNLKSSDAILEKLTSFDESLDKIKIGEIREGVFVRDLSFSYKNKKILIDKMSLDLVMGKKYLLIGPSGAGKSTLMKILAGYIGDYEGEILYDGIEARKIDFKSLMNQIIYIDQDVYIFNDSIKFNINLGKEIDEKTYQKALDLACLNKLIESKNEGDNFVINADGSNISGGERQMIAIARAIASGKKVFFVDEGLQGMDVATKNQIELNLLGENIMLVMISHVSDDNKKLYDEIIELK